MNDTRREGMDVSKVEDKASEPLKSMTIDQAVAETVRLEPQGPSLRGEISIKLFSDGSTSINGPLDDAILFKGMLMVAYDTQNAYTANREKEMARLAAIPPAKRENWAVRQLRKVREKKERIERERMAEALAKADAKKAADMAASGAISRTPPTDAAVQPQGGTPSPVANAQ